MIACVTSISVLSIVPAVSTTAGAKRPRSRNLYLATNGFDRGDCISATSPCRTFNYVDSQAAAGDVVHVAAGTYDLTSSTCIVTNTSGVTWQSDVHGAATINGGGNCQYMWHNSGASGNIKIFGFQFTGVQVNSNLNSFGVLLEGCYGGFEVAYNTFHDFGTSSSSDNFAAALSAAPYGCGTGNYTGTTCSLHDNVFRNIAPGGAFTYNGYAIYEICGNDNGAQSDPQIYNNLIYNEGSIAIQLWHAANHTHIYNNTIDHAQMGILVGTGDQGAVNGAISDVSNNIVSNSYYGIYAEDGSGYTLSPSTTFDNNLTYGNTYDWVYNQNGNWVSILNSFSNAGNRSGNPQFVSPSTGNYVLAPTSPAVANGLHNSFTPALDLAGVARPNPPSIGGYEP